MTFTHTTSVGSVVAGSVVHVMGHDGSKGRGWLEIQKVVEVKKHDGEDVYCRMYIRNITSLRSKGIYITSDIPDLRL